MQARDCIFRLSWGQIFACSRRRKGEIWAWKRTPDGLFFPSRSWGIAKVCEKVFPLKSLAEAAT